MFVAWLTLATANVAAINGMVPQSRDFSDETRALRPLLEKMGERKPQIISTPDGVALQLFWWTSEKQGDFRVQLDRRKEHPMLVSPPGWAERTKVLGFDAVRAPHGATRGGSSSVAGYWVWAPPYVVQVDVDPNPNGPRVWDAAAWSANDAKARERVEEALKLLGEAGLINILDEKVVGALSVTAQSTTGGVISGLKINLSVPGRAGPITVTTDEFGRAKTEIPIAKPDRDLEGKAVSCTYTAATKVGGTLLRLVTPMTLEFTTPFKLTKAASFRGTLGMRFFVRPIYVKVEHSTSSDAVTDCLITINEGEVNGRAIIRAYPRDNISRDGSGLLKLLMPVSRTNGGQPATVYAAQNVKGVVYEGWDGITLPSNTIESATAIIELAPLDLAGQFQKYRPRLKETLEAAGFTQAEITRILAVRIRLGAGNNYLDGVITMARDSTLRGSSENLLHEFGHLITDVVAPDEPEGVGLSREGGGPTNPVSAWDEGRAHLYSSLLGQALRLPGSRATTDDPAANPDNLSREPMVHRALMEFYGNRAFFANPAAALGSFRSVHERARQQLGRPPRTMTEFLNVAGGMDGLPAAQAATLERIRTQYGFGN